jgi:hypothetical protein
VEHVACIIETLNTYKILVRKPEGKKPFEILRHKCEDNVTMPLKEIGW